jgi:hypothetical protein
MREILFPHRLLGAGERGENSPEINGLFSAATLNKKFAIVGKSTTYAKIPLTGPS